MIQIRKLISILQILMLVLTIISFFSTNALAETNVTEITLGTDSSWKIYDVEVKGWTSIDFDDSYWLTPREGGLIGKDWGKTRGINYPEEYSLSRPPFYFRKIFELGGTSIMSGKLYYSIPFCNGLSTYVNENYVDTDDITPYIKIGKNVIAVKSTVAGSSIWPCSDNIFGLMVKIRVVSASASFPSPVLTSTIMPTPTATLQPGISGQTSKSASVSLTGEKTDVAFGEDIVLKLSAVNLITKPVMHVQVIILVPSGMSVTSSDFSKSGTNQFTANYELNPGDGKDVEVKIRPNQVGDFNVNGRIVYYFGDDKNTAEDNTLNLPIKVRGIDPTSQPTPQSKAPGFEIIFVIGMLIISYLYIRKT